MTIKQRLVYIATPYSRYPHGMQQAFENACDAAAALMEQGVAVFCPIAMSHAIETEQVKLKAPGWPKDGEFWLNIDKAILKHCTDLFVVQMEGWDNSIGVAEEIAFALAHDIPITYLPWGVSVATFD
jgi:hypothetical protein